jgi:hypothetical protein
MAQQEPQLSKFQEALFNEVTKQRDEALMKLAASNAALTCIMADNADLKAEIAIRDEKDSAA